MIDWIMTPVVVGGLALITSLLAGRHPPAIRRWMWVAFIEYLLCALYQYFNGADANGYRQAGTELMRFLDASFGWAAPEMLSLLFQQPSAFDAEAIGPGSNTGSMCAAAAWVLFLVRGSPYAAQALVAGLALFGSLAIYDAFRDACPEVSPQRLFAAAVLFPSVAFWTSALHKEAFCLMGTGLFLAAWRAIYQRKQLRAILYAPVGVLLIVLFRPPALPPLLLGLVLYYVVERIQARRGIDQAAARPVYFLIGILMMALGMVLVSRVAPTLGMDRIGDTVSNQQRAWGALAAAGGGGGSGFDLDETTVVSTGGQFARAPLSLVNALLRPQLFDVTSTLVLISALEMTAITALILRAIWINGVATVVTRIQRSPFLLMCAVITFVGCTFVGLTTFNFGTLARYRVPFLPFYGALLAGLSQKVKDKRGQQVPALAPRRKLPRRRLGGPVAPLPVRTGSR